MANSIATMYGTINMSDGLNDDLIATLYYKQYNDTIGVKVLADKYQLHVYNNGFYDEFEANRIVNDRVGKILHEIKEIGSAVLEDTDPEDKDETIKAARSKAKEILRFAEACHNEGRRNSINARLAKTKAVSPDTMDINKNIVPLPNGALIIDWEHNTVGYDSKFHPEALNTMKLAVDYIPGAKCPKWENEIRESLSYKIVPGEKREDTDNIEKEIRLLRAIAGYMLLQGNPEQVVTMFKGTGGSFKSTIAYTITDVLGNSKNGCGMIARRELVIELNGNKIRADEGEAVTKRCAVVDEFIPRDTIDMGRTKYLTGSRVLVEVKHKNPYQRENNVKLILVSNHENRFSSTDDSVERRVITLRFYRPRPEIQIGDYDKILVAEEGPGILNWMIEGLLDVLKNGGLSKIVPENIKKDIRDTLAEQDKLTPFLNDCFKKPAPGQKIESVPLAEIFSAMQSYYDYKNVDWPVRSDRALSSMLKEHRYDFHRVGTGIKFYGILVNHPGIDKTGITTFTASKNDEGLIMQLDRIIKTKVQELTSKNIIVLPDSLAFAVVREAQDFSVSQVKRHIDKLLEIGELYKSPNESLAIT